MTILAAYPLSRRDFFGRNVVMALFTFTILFNGGLIPTYLLVKNLRHWKQDADLTTHQMVTDIKSRKVWLKVPVPDYFADWTEVDLKDIWG